MSIPPSDEPLGHAHRAKLGDLAASAGIRRVHILAWRDLADVEAGGSEVHAATVARIWAEAGIEVFMRTSFAQGSPPRAVRDGYEVYRRAGRYAIFPRAALAELSGRHGTRDALVEIWNGVPFFSPLWASGPRVTFLHHHHEKMWPLVLPPHYARIGTLLESRIAPLVYRRTTVVTLSESSRRDIVQKLGLRPHRVRVVPPGVDERFTPGGERSSRPLIVAVGRLMPSKRFDELIRHVHRARETRPDIELVIVGDGYERDALRELITELDAGSWVRLAGRVDDDELVDLYRRAWLVASASISEGWGMTLTEAAACGTPAVATRIAGHEDAVVDGTTGLLVPVGGDLAGAILRVVNDDALRSRLSANAREHAARFTWEATAYGTMQALVDDARRRRRR
ncbi:MAG TPA: glycosyltransferase family 4 protein [Acidimicrobiales bacterium]